MSKNVQPGHAGALLHVGISRRQYESCVVVVKLSIGGRLERRHLKTLNVRIIMLNILRLNSRVRSRSGQRSQWSVSTFWALELVKRTVNRSHSHKVLDRCPQRILHKYKGHTYRGQGQGQVIIVHDKIKVTNMLCDTCFLGHLARRYRWWQSTDLMTSSKLTFDRFQVKFRSRRSNFQINIFYIKNMFLAQNLHRIPNTPLDFC